MHPQAAMNNEAESTALRLVKTHGDGALDYAQRKIDYMDEIGDRENHAFWEQISACIERHLYHGTT